MPTARATTRRSRAARDSGINVTMIHLYNVSRLKSELQARGLDTKGQKTALADRLQAFLDTQTKQPAEDKEEAMDTEEEEEEVVVKTPSPAKRKRGRPPFRQPEEKEPTVDPVPETLTSQQTISSFVEQLAKFLPSNYAESPKPNDQPEKPTRRSTRLRAAELSTAQNDAPETIEEPEVVEKSEAAEQSEAVQEPEVVEEPVVIMELEKTVELIQTPFVVTLPVPLPETPTVADVTACLSESEVPTSVPQKRKAKTSIESKTTSEPAVKKRSVEATAKTTVSTTPKSISLRKSSAASSATKTIPVVKQLSISIKTSEPVKRPSLTPIEQKRQSLSRNSSNSTPAVTPKATTVQKRPSTSSAAGSVGTSRQSTSGSGMFDIFDTILNQQDEMLKERNKTEVEKSAERTKLELEKRRKKKDNPYALTPFEKATGNIQLLSRKSSSDSQMSPNLPTTAMELNPRDPLGLLTEMETPQSNSPVASQPPIAIVPPTIVAPTSNGPVAQEHNLNVPVDQPPVVQDQISPPIEEPPVNVVAPLGHVHETASVDVFAQYPPVFIPLPPTNYSTPHTQSIDAVPPAIATAAAVPDYLIDEIPLPSAPDNSTANDQLRSEETDDEDDSNQQIDMMALYSQSQSILTKPTVHDSLPEISLDMIPIPDSPPPNSAMPSSSKQVRSPETQLQMEEQQKLETEPQQQSGDKNEVVEAETENNSSVEQEQLAEEPTIDEEEEDPDEEVEGEDYEDVEEDIEELEEPETDENSAIPANPQAQTNSTVETVSTSIAGIPLDPSTLLRIGDEVLEAYHRDLNVTNPGEITYGQVLEDPDPNTSNTESKGDKTDGNSNGTSSEPKPLPEFYGEPVPDDDDNDDALFEMAAGLPPRKRRGEVDGADNEEPLPDDSQIELDYFNADMNIKADAKDKWLIDPDNGDGFALMWGCVKATFGIRLPTPTTNVRSNADQNSEPIPADPVNSRVNSFGSDSTSAIVQEPSTSTTPTAPSESFPAIVYQVRIVEYLSLKHVPFEEAEPYDLRVGWSTANVQAPVGEAEHSYAFCRLGRRAHGNIFTDYGQTVSIGDVVTDIAANEIRYFVNETDLGVAFTPLNFQSPNSNGIPVVHPHIGLKNVKVAVNFGNSESATETTADETEKTSEWKLPTALQDRPAGTVKFFGQIDRQHIQMVPTLRPPASKANCTVLMMVGLPGAGKTHWVRKYLLSHSHERWITLNTDMMLNLMKVNGVPRKRVHQGRWDVIMGLAAKALSRSLTLACRRRHNYIIDQTNVSREARRKKLTLFKDFIRRCVVIVPTAEDFEHRQLRQARIEPANQIPPEAMLELKGQMSLPEIDLEPLEDVHFVEPDQSNIGDAIELVRQYNEEGKPYLQNKRRHKRPEPMLSDSRGQPNQWNS
ncbi:SPRY domain-containing protein [Aphelenchoides besseyi]|nr:SPRY domain-containing protein [Aphelenchoides besseyi]KAI6198683.1 SPRY domain-containing protein [Aphelenchoides besseyi]